MKRHTLVLWILCAALLMGALTLTLAQDAPTEEPPTADVAVGTAPPPDFVPTALPRPDAISTVSENGITLSFYFERIKQGRVGVVGLSGDGIVGARVDFLGKLIDFYQGQDGQFYALLSVSMEQPVREYDTTFYAILPDDSRKSITAKVAVASGEFLRQDVEIPSERAYLIDPEVERTEFARMAAVFETSAKETLWDARFVLPMPSEITSSFGAVRVMNGSAETRHTGWDLRATVGKPIGASAAGKVVFAGRLDIRGNHVIIDHGNGVMSGYSHMSQVHVTRGQSVTQGQILGMSGNTGRSSGPHLHWEMTVNGDFVDSVDFINMWLPN